MNLGRKAKTHLFDGEQLTVREIAQRVPAMSLDAVRKHLRAGRNTRQAVLAFDGKANSRAASVANAAKLKRRLR